MVDAHLAQTDRLGAIRLKALQRSIDQGRRQIAVSRCVLPADHFESSR
jgi:hypothetical protein